MRRTLKANSSANGQRLAAAELPVPSKVEGKRVGAKLLCHFNLLERIKLAATYRSEH